MSATNGSLRSRSRLIGLALAVVFALSALFATAAGATTIPIKEKYLALGDSLAFGYSQQLFNEHLPAPPPTAFERGYAFYYASLKKFKAEGLQIVNNGCPGETTDSLIGNGPLGSVLDPVEGESPCAYHKVGLGLHNEYGGTKSQLESALEVIGVAAAHGTPVTTISLNIGANDELHAIAKCKAEVQHEYETEGKSKYGATPEAAVKGCIEAHVEALFGHILHNIGSILFTLRNGSLFGSVNYTGKIIFQGGYDPYGRVYKTAEEVTAAQAIGPQFKEAHLGELLTGSIGLAALLNFHEQKLVTDEGAEAAAEGHEAFKGCFVNPETNAVAATTFNPGLPKEAGLLGTLQKYTNMNNQTSSNGQPNGPDIHPTPVGYKRLGQLMFAGCG
jgi:hypothetical protein